MNNIRFIEEIPPNYRTVFQEYPCFNTIQSAVLDDALKTDNSLVVSAPTGSGKTAIFEMAIVRLLILNENTDTTPNFKMIYISPIKALCRERLIDWHKKFTDYGIKCISLTGDTNDTDVRNISHFNLIISTPEKWDVLTRKWRDNQSLVAAINLFMIDEVHLLNVESRGSTLEVIVSRMKTAEAFMQLTGEKSKIRFVALSATIPNVEDIAEWIESSNTAKYFRFSEDVRPVKLDKVVYGFYNNCKSAFKFDLSLNYKLPNIINKYSQGRPTLIFCSTRKSVEMTTNHLFTSFQIRLTVEQKKVLYQISNQINDVKLRQFAIHGIALHHAGLTYENRDIIENSFREGHLPILVTTSTLAMGVNLPAHLVIIKGTKRYDTNEGYKDYDEVSIFQMIGRAGRSKFDTSATAIILTSNQDKVKYEQMLNCTQKIESNLHKHLTEHLNAEIVLKTITDLEVAMNWLSSTFLYVRARKCPEKYKLPAGLSKEKIDKKLLEICQIDLNKLVRAGMIKMNQAIEVAPTVVGEIMAKYYIAFNTMELFTKISGNEIMIQILALFSKCHEFSEIHLRSNDKKCLNLLNKNAHKDSIRFPLNGRIKTVDMKINCIIQAVLGNLDIPDQSVFNDSVRVMRNCERLANCLIEYLETRTKCYTALLNTIILAKCFHVKLWENSPYVSKQLTGVGQVISTLLTKAGKSTFKEIINTNPRHIEMIVGRKAPFGNTLVDEVSHLPEYQMTLEKCDNAVNLVLNLVNPNVLEEAATIKLSSKMTLLVGDSDNNILLYEKYAHSYMLDHPKVTRSLNIENLNPTFITADLISEDWVGFDCHFKLELLDLFTQPPNTAHNKNSKQTFIETYLKKVRKVNLNKKKNEAKTVMKKNPSNTENEDQTSGYREDKDKNLSNNKGKHNICETENTRNIDLCNNKDNKINDEDSSQFANNIYLEPKNDELTRVSKAVRNSQNKNKKAAQCKKKKICVAKSIFRTESKSKHGDNQERKYKSEGTDNLGSESHFNISVDDNFSEGRKFVSQNSEMISELKENSASGGKVTNQVLDNDKNQINHIKSENRFLEEDFPCKNQNNTFKKNEPVLESSILNTGNANIMKRNVSDDFFLHEFQINAAVDDLEKYSNKLEKNKLHSRHQEFDNSKNKIQIKTTHLDVQGKNRKNISETLGNNVSNQFSPIYFHCKKKNVDHFFPLQSPTKPAIQKMNIGQSKQQETEKFVHATLFKNVNDYSSDSGYEKENRSHVSSRDFHTSVDFNNCDKTKMDPKFRAHCLINNNEYNTSLTKCNDKEEAAKPDGDIIDDNFSEGRKFVSQNSEMISELKENSASGGKVPNQVLDNDKNQINHIKSENRFLEEDFPCKNQNNTFKKNEPVLESSILNTGNANIMKRNVSDHFFLHEFQINAAVDDLEKYSNKLEKNKLHSRHQQFDNSKNKIQIKTTHLDFQEKNRQNISETLGNNVSNQFSPIYFHCKKKNVDHFFPLQSPTKPAIQKMNIGQSKQQETEKFVHATLFKNVNDYSSDSGYEKEKRSHVSSRDFHTSVDFNNCDKTKMDPKNRAHCLINNNEYNTSLTKCNDKEEAAKPDGDIIENNEKLCNFGQYTDLYKKYNLESQSTNKKSGEKYEKKRNRHGEKIESVEESQGVDIKVTMNYPYSLGMRNSSQREHFPQSNAKRYRDIDDSFSSFDGSQVKRIKWRSPLVHSSPEASFHSKRNESFCLDFNSSNGKENPNESNDLRLGTQETSSSSTNLNLSENSQQQSNRPSRQKLTLPLCDNDYLENTDIKCLEDIIDLESFGMVGRKGNARKNTGKKFLHPRPSAGEYYSQLMSSQSKNLRKYPDTDHKVEDYNNEAAPYGFVREPTLCVPQNTQQSQISEANYADTNNVMPYSQFGPGPKPIQTNIYSKNITQEYYKQKINRHEPDECKPENFNYYSGNENYLNWDNLQQDTATQRCHSRDDLLQHSFTNEQKSNEILRQRCINNDYYSGNNRSLLPPDLYLNYQEPCHNNVNYQQQEIVPPYSVPFSHPSMYSRYPISRYGNINPYFKEPYPGFMLIPDYPEEHISNAILKPTPVYHSHTQIGTSLKEYAHPCNQTAQDLHDVALHFPLHGNGNKNEEQPLSHFDQNKSPYERKINFNGDNQKHSSSNFYYDNRNEQESRYPQLIQNRDRNFINSQPCCRSKFCNNKSHFDDSLENSNSEVYIQNKGKYEGFPKTFISQMFSQIPKKQLDHNQSQKSALPKTPDSHLIIRLPTHRRLLNLNTFDERLDNMVSLRSQSFTAPTTVEQHVPRNNLTSISNQPNDKEFVMNRFIFSNNGTEL